VGGRALVVAAAVTARPTLGSDPVIGYVLPLRCDACAAGAHDELASYLRGLAGHATVIVADGSPWPAYARHARAFGRDVVHVPLDPDVEGFANGKVAGVTTGVRAATTERVIVADDDVRYTASSLEAVAGALDDADLVVPQNVFSGRLPWHARWDGARSLLNRATGFDPPGTLALRRSAFLAAGGYDGDVLFENLELIRTIEASGGRVVVRRDLAVERHAPTARRFVEQRVRQAYDEFARPTRLVAFLALMPVTVRLTRRARWAPAAMAAAAVAVAEFGRRRDGGRAMFPPTTSLFAPLWLAERAVTSWLALASRVFRGGVPYRGRVLRRSATSMRRLRDRHEQAPLRATHHTAA
jgi:hypothetical protein